MPELPFLIQLFYICITIFAPFRFANISVFHDLILDCGLEEDSLQWPLKMDERGLSHPHTQFGPSLKCNLGQLSFPPSTEIQSRRQKWQTILIFVWKESKPKFNEGQFYVGRFNGYSVPLWAQITGWKKTVLWDSICNGTISWYGKFAKGKMRRHKLAQQCGT